MLTPRAKHVVRVIEWVIRLAYGSSWSLKMPKGTYSVLAVQKKVGRNIRISHSSAIQGTRDGWNNSKDWQNGTDFVFCGYKDNCSSISSNEIADRFASSGAILEIV